QLFLIGNILKLSGKVVVQFQIKAAIFCKILLRKLLNAAVHLVKIVGEKSLPGFEISYLWFERFLFIRPNIGWVGNNQIQGGGYFYGSRREDIFFQKGYIGAILFGICAGYLQGIR